jgi:hypothetical protein
MATSPEHPAGCAWELSDSQSRRNLSEEYHVKPEMAARLACSSFDVLLSHDAPRDAVYAESGNTEIRDVLLAASPVFAFFGHYHDVGRRLRDVGRTEVYHLNGMELHGPGGCADEGSVGVLTWTDGQGAFDYVPFAWLRRFTRHNWRYF